jgi:hypothetical protein
MTRRGPYCIEEPSERSEQGGELLEGRVADAVKEGFLGINWY